MRVFGYTLGAHLGPFLISSFAFVKGKSESKRLAFAPECEPAQAAIQLPEFGPQRAAKSSPRATGSADCRGMKQNPFEPSSIFETRSQLSQWARQARQCGQVSG